MSIQELETQLLNLDRDDQVHMLQLLERSLRSTAEKPPQPRRNLADLFRNSPLAEAIASGELDLTRDQTIEPDRFIL
jgi:hypothetical protein